MHSLSNVHVHCGQTNVGFHNEVFFLFSFFFLGNSDSYLDVRRRLYHQNARNGQSMSPHCSTKETMSINNDQQTEALLEEYTCQPLPPTSHYPWHGSGVTGHHRNSTDRDQRSEMKVFHGGMHGRIHNRTVQCTCA